MIGIYYLDYSDRPFPKSARKMIIGYTKDGLLSSIEERKIPDNYLCWFQECRTPGYLFEGTLVETKEWISKHMPDKFGEPLNG